MTNKFKKYTYHFTKSVIANSKKDGRSEIEANFSEGVRIMKDDMKLLKISHATKKEIKERLEMIEWEKQNYLEWHWMCMITTVFHAMAE